MRRTVSRCAKAPAIRAAIFALAATVGVYVVVICSGNLLMSSLHHPSMQHQHLQLTGTGLMRTLNASFAAIDSAMREGNGALEGGEKGGREREGEMQSIALLPPPPQPDTAAVMAIRAATVAGVPRVVHVLWAHPAGTTFLFQQALSLLSIRRFVAPHSLCFWYTAGKPTGAWWHFARLALPYLVTVPLNGDSDLHLSRRDDDVRAADVDVETTTALRILLKHGGIFVSLNTAVVRPIDSLLAYHVTVGLGNVLPGFMMSTAQSAVLRQWLAELDSGEDAATRPLSPPRATARTILTRYSQFVHYESVDHLEDTAMSQVAFVEPLVYDELGGESPLVSDQSLRHSVVDMTERQPCRHYDPHSILALNTTRGRVFRYIYYGNQEYAMY